MKTQPQASSPGPLLKVAEAARIIGVSENTLRNQLHEGRWLALCISGEPNAGRECLRIVRLSLSVKKAERLAAWSKIISEADNWLFPERRQAVNVNDVASALCCSSTHVTDLCEARSLHALDIGVGGQRKHLRIMRASVVHFVSQRLKERNGL